MYKDPEADLTQDMSELARETGDDYTLLKERKYIDRAGLGFFTVSPNTEIIVFIM